MAALRADGLGGYGPVPWCSECCLPRSRCPSWTKLNGDGTTTSEWDRENDQLWLVRGGSRCVFRDIVVNAVSAMLSFQFSHTNVFGHQVQAWRDGSWIRFNKTLGLEGWLASPIAWDRRDVMVILYVFCRLDNAVEDMWIDSQIKHRRTILGLRGSEFCWAKRGDPGREILHTDDQEITSTWRDRARDALKEAEYQSMQSYGYCGELSFLRLLRARAQLWHRGSIRCHVCIDVRMERGLLPSQHDDVYPAEGIETRKCSVG